MSTETALVTIGLPVYNGEQYLAKAIESVLSQTYEHLELVISDNGSTDSTKEICERFVQQDPRIRYFRAEKNRGASWNYNRTVELARGEYFRWLAHDDVLAPSLVEESVTAFRARPDASVCITWVADVDEHGNTLETKRAPGEFLSLDVYERFQAMTDPHYSCEAVFGLVRTEMLKRTKMIADYADSDRTLIVELGLDGPFCEVPEALFQHRQHESRFVKEYRSAQDRTAWFNPDAKGKLIFPMWRQFAELLKVVRRSSLPLAVRMKCYGHLITWVTSQPRRMRQNFIWAFRQVAPAPVAGWKLRR